MVSCCNWFSKKTTNYLWTGVLSSLAVGGSILLRADFTRAQIAPDATLPVNSRVAQEVNIFEITDGTRAGGNLFHSFAEFSIPTGTEAYFNQSMAIENIIARVTGGSISNIDGLIRANGSANLLFINPGGIRFGPNASLNIGGSFLASTASSIEFPNGIEFSATNPGSEPLLTINVPIGLQFGPNPGSINNQGANLEVKNGNSLALAGGDVVVESGSLSAPGGRIELGSVAGAGSVDLSQTDGGLSLQYPEDLRFGNIRLSGTARADVSDDKSGEIRMRGGLIELSDRARVESNTGNLDGGGIAIEGNNFRLQDKATVLVSTDGEGDAGNIQVTASDSLELTGSGEPLEFGGRLLLGFAEPSDLNTGLYSVTLGDGNGGDITIDTQTLTLNRALAANFTVFSGASGAITVNASDSINIIGAGLSSQDIILNTISEITEQKLPIATVISEVFNLARSGLLNVNFGGDGNAGDITINTGNSTLADGGGVASITLGNSPAGFLTINASESATIENRSFLLATTVGTGNAGNVVINAPEISVIDKSLMSADTLAEGNAGNLEINAERFVVDEGGIVSASTIASSFGDGGQGGSITINASESVELLRRGGIFTQSLSSGDAGDIKIDTGRFIIRTGVEPKRAGITTASLGRGAGGDIIVNANESVEIIGNIEDGLPISEPHIREILFSTNRKIVGLATITGGDGDAGNITLNTGRLVIRNGAGMITSSAGTGSGGDISINASESVEMTGLAALLTTTVGEGNGGDLTVETERLTLRDGAGISADAFGLSDALVLLGFQDDILRLQNDSDSQLTSDSGRIFNGNAGDLRITAREISVLNGSRIGAGTGVESLGNGGNLTVRALDLIEIAGISADEGQVPSSISANTTGAGDAGNLRIETAKLIVSDFGEISVSASDAGAAGILEAIAPDIFLNRGTISAETTAGLGNIILETDTLQMLDSSRITTNATGTVTGGNISINTDILAALDNSDISANAEQDFGGRVSINTQGIFGTAFRDAPTPESDITASSLLGPNFSGVVEINTPDVDPTSSLLNLPETPVDAAGLVDRSCTAGNPRRSTFVAAGRSGNPRSPKEPLFSNVALAGSVREASPQENREASPQENRSSMPDRSVSSYSDRIVEAQGWIINADGEVELVAEAPAVIPYNPRFVSNCGEKRNAIE